MQTCSSRGKAQLRVAGALVRSAGTTEPPTFSGLWGGKEPQTLGILNSFRACLYVPKGTGNSDLGQHRVPPSESSALASPGMQSQLLDQQWSSWVASQHLCGMLVSQVRLNLLRHSASPSKHFFLT